MSDERLKTLEQRFRESGQVDDEAAWLVERIRVGGLSRAQLNLAASLGHPAARAALGRPRDHDLARALEAMRGAERELRVRVALALARFLQERLQRPEWGPPLDRVSEWLAAPSARGARACRDEDPSEWSEQPGGSAVSAALWCVTEPSDRDDPWPPYHYEAWEEACEVSGNPAAVAEALQAALIPWVLPAAS